VRIHIDTLPAGLTLVAGTTCTVTLAAPAKAVPAPAHT
jgi:hypothetical protein